MSFFQVATCQFSVSADIQRNSRYMQRMIQAAAAQGARVVHFPESALSGYAGTNLKTWEGYDWERLGVESEKIRALARDCSVWVLFGSAHRLSEGHLPHNSVYVVDPAGEIVERYDKRFCTQSDLEYYTPGNRLALFEIEGLRCGVLICHDVRYPELNRKYHSAGVRCLFYSFYNASAQGKKIHTIIMRPSLQAHAANNHMWLSVSNASTYYQTWPSVFVAPDGRILQSLRQHRSGMMINTVDTEEEFLDKCSFKDLAIKGILHSGTLVDDPRSEVRDSF
jgi:predicted amidohydrolase